VFVEGFTEPGLFFTVSRVIVILGLRRLGRLSHERQSGQSLWTLDLDGLGDLFEFLEDVLDDTGGSEGATALGGVGRLEGLALSIAHKVLFLLRILITKTCKSLSLGRRRTSVEGVVEGRRS